jgi:hemolysin activation/secretion protein
VKFHGFKKRLVQSRSAKLGFMLLSAFFGLSVYAQSPAPAPAPIDPTPQLRRQQEQGEAARQRQEPRVDVQAGEQQPVALERLGTESPCFNIQKITLRGADAQQFSWVLDSLSGPQKDDAPEGKCLGAQGINTLLKRGQDMLIARGFVTSRLLAEPQDLKTGSLALTMLAGRIRNIRFAPGTSSRANAWNAVPAQKGDILNLRDIEQGLENFKRVPTAEADIKIEPAEGADAQPGYSDLVISWQQASIYRISVSIDDSGSKGTGKYQGGATLSLDHLLTLNDLFYITLNRDLGGSDPGPRGTKGRTLHYSVPLGYWTLAATASQSRYYQTVLGANQDYVYSGTSGNTDIKLSRLVYRDAQRKTTVSARAFQRKSNNFIDDTEVQVQERKVGGWEAAVAHREFLGQAVLDVSLAYKRGTGAFGSLAAPEEDFGEGTSRFALITADVNLSAPFKIGAQKFKYTSTLRLQSQRTPLTPQDRFAIGGRYSVRGFDGESSLSAERGWTLRNEIGIPLGDSGQEFYTGLDYGHISGPSSEFLLGKSLAGIALGLRGGFKGFAYDLFAAAPVHKPEGFRTKSQTYGFNLNYSF